MLDIPVIGRDREDAASIVEKLRGRTTAATFAQRHHAGTADEHIGRYRLLADRGVKTVFVSLPHLTDPEDVLLPRPACRRLRLSTALETGARVTIPATATAYARSAHERSAYRNWRLSVQDRLRGPNWDGRAGQDADGLDLSSALGPARPPVPCAGPAMVIGQIGLG